MGIKLNINGTDLSLRKFIEVLASGINATKTTFSTFVNLKKFELKFNGQSIYLSEYLNQVFDPTLKRIYIINDVVLLPSYFFRTSEVIQPEEQLYLFRTSEIITDDEQVYLEKGGIGVGSDFQVLIPSALSSLETNPQFLASVRKYKLVDKEFEVIIY